MYNLTYWLLTMTYTKIDKIIILNQKKMSDIPSIFCNLLYSSYYVISYLFNFMYYTLFFPLVYYMNVWIRSQPALTSFVTRVSV